MVGAQAVGFLDFTSVSTPLLAACVPGRPCDLHTVGLSCFQTTASLELVKHDNIIRHTVCVRQQTRIRMVATLKRNSPGATRGSAMRLPHAHAVATSDPGPALAWPGWANDASPYAHAQGAARSHQAVALTTAPGPAQRAASARNYRSVARLFHSARRETLSEKQYPPYQKKRSIICLVRPYLVQYGP